MTDIATLGLAIDSRQAVTAKAALDQLTASAKPAAQAATALQQATAASSAALAGNSTATDSNSLSLRGQRLVIRGLASDLALLGPQFGQVAGMAGLLYIENAHLFTGFGSLKSAIGALITPTNLLIGGLAAVAVGAYATYESIKTTELAFGELSERTNTTVQQLHAFESAASFKGVDTTDFLKGMTKFGDLSAQATDNLGSMAELFKANNVQAGTLDDNLLHASDLIANARSEADKYRIIQQLGLPATREWVQYLGQGSDALREAATQAVQLGGVADENLIAKARVFDETMATAWKNFVNYGRQAFVEAEAGWGGYFKLIQDGYAGIKKFAAEHQLGGDGSPFSVGKAKLTLGLGGSQMTAADAAKFYGATGAGTSAATNDPEVIKQSIANAQPLIEAVGRLPTAKESKQKERKAA